MSGTETIGRPQSAAGMPAVIPVFPLSGALLLPGTTLPLNIFEPRYLAMVQDTLANPARIIGMIQPREDGDEDDPPALYGYGCAGRLISFVETPDGRFLITLAGLCRFALRRECTAATPYRQVEADYEDFSGDFEKPHIDEAAVDRKTLLEHMRAYVSTLDLDADWPSIEKTDTATLVNWLAVLCPFEPREKQALLEAGDMMTRYRTLDSLLTMAVADKTGSETGEQ